MTAMKNATRVYTDKDLRAYLESMSANEFRVHLYDYIEGDSSEDPVAQLFSVEETLEYVHNNVANVYYIGEIGYEILAFNHNYIGSVIY